MNGGVLQCMEVQYHPSEIFMGSHSFSEVKCE